MEAIDGEIVFKAVSPDNSLHVKKIVELFIRSYGDSFPVKQVYTPEFWRSRIGNKLTSFVAEQNGEFVGHLAACPDRENSKHVQICVPAFDKKLGEITPKVAAQLWEMIERAAQRQGWTAAYKFLTSSLPQVEELVGITFGFSDIAVYPGCSVTQTKRAACQRSQTEHPVRIHPPVMLAERSFIRETENQIAIYPPTQHAEIVKYLYEPLKLGRRFDADANNNELTPALAADSQALEISSFPHSAIAHLFVQPSLLQSFDSTVFDLKGHKFDDFIVFASLFDSKTPQFCQFLEEQGLSFCGIVPILRGRDNIVYANASSGLLESANFSSARARRLIKYIGEYSSPKKSKGTKRKVITKNVSTAQSGINDR